MEVSRRFVLRVLTGLGLFLVLATGLGYQHRRRLYREYVALRLDITSPTGTLGEQEFATIAALFDVVAATRPQGHESLRTFVDWRTGSIPGYYREYRSAAGLLDADAQDRFGTHFALLDRGVRDEILRGALPRHPLLPLQAALPPERAEPPGFLEKLRVAIDTVVFHDRARLKYFVFWDLLSFYWTSAPAWRLLGYRTYPGVPDTQNGYTSPPGGFEGA